jgi:hypothetical protein
VLECAAVAYSRGLAPAVRCDCTAAMLETRATDTYA